MEAVFDSYETQMSMNWAEALGGLTQWKEWMMAREKRIRQLVEDELAGPNHPETSIEPIDSHDQPVGDKEANNLRPLDTGIEEIMFLLTTLTDKLHQVTALNQFGDDATIALLNTGYEIDSNTRFGMNEFYALVRENEIGLKATLNKLKEQLHDENTEIEITREENTDG